MTRNQIMKAAKRLAKTNGLMSVFYNQMTNTQQTDPQKFDKLMTAMENLNFQTDDDLIQYVCC